MRQPDVFNPRDDLTAKVCSIEHKLDILTSTMVRNIIDNDSTVQPNKPTFAKITAKAVIDSFVENLHTQPTTSSSGEIADELWKHIAKQQTAQSDVDDTKRSVIVSGAPYNSALGRAERQRTDTTFARNLATELGVDPSHIQRVFRFRQNRTDERPPLMKITFLTESAKETAILERWSLQSIANFSAIRIRPSLPLASREHRDILYYGATHHTFDPDKIVKCIYNSRNEKHELKYTIHDEQRNFDRVDWATNVDYNAADYASWKTAVSGRRNTARPTAVASGVRGSSVAGSTVVQLARTVLAVQLSRVVLVVRLSRAVPVVRL